jgi:hypothetical protein
VKVGDELLVDGGMVRFEVIEKIGPDVKCRCTDPGLMLPRANLTFWRDGSLVRERNAMLPTISSKVGASDLFSVIEISIFFYFKCESCLSLPLRVCLSLRLDLYDRLPSSRFFKSLRGFFFSFSFGGWCLTSYPDQVFGIQRCPGD